MDTIPVVYFSFRDDAALLEQSIRALRRLESRDPSLHIPVYVFDDGEHPLPSVPDGVHYEATTFPRNGNLMGIACLRGMVECYNRVFRMEPHARVLVKCDCDTILNGMGAAKAALSAGGSAFSGSQWGNRYMCGQRYALTRDAVWWVAERLGRDRVEKWLELTHARGEDMSLTMVCRCVPYCRILFDDPASGLLLRDDFDSPFDPRLRRHDAVVFKEQTGKVPQEAAAAERAAAACLMSEYNGVAGLSAVRGGESPRTGKCRDGRVSLPVAIHPETVDIGGVPYDIADRRADGSLVVRREGADRVLVWNRYTGGYILTRPGGSLRIQRNRDWCQLVKCDALKFACFIISKNGCSCLMASAVRHDTRVSLGGRFVWNDPRAFGNGCLAGAAKAVDLVASGALDGYRKFVVVQDERERFCRAVNWTHCPRSRAYNPFVDLSLPRHESFMEHLLLYPYMTADEYNCDQHFLPQSVHIDAAVARVYGGDRARFDREVERVRLSDLGEWFADSFGVPMELNNMDSKDDEIYWPDTLTDEERSAMESVVKPFEL